MLGRPAATRYPQPENRTSDDSTPHPPSRSVDRGLRPHFSAQRAYESHCADTSAPWHVVGHLRLAAVAEIGSGLPDRLNLVLYLWI